MERMSGSGERLGEPRGPVGEDPEGGAVARMYKIGGARSLVGLGFYYRPPQETRVRRVKLNKLNEDGNSYKGEDVQAKVGLIADITPGELTVGLRTRRRSEDIVRLMRACDVNPRPFIDPLLEDVEEGEGGYRTPKSDFERYQGGGRFGRRSAPPYELEGRYPAHRGGYGEIMGGVGVQARGGAQTPRPLQRGPGFGGGLDRGVYGGLGGSATPHLQFAPQVQHAGGMVRSPAIPGAQFQYEPHMPRQAAQGLGFGASQPQLEQREEPGGLAAQVESLTKRVSKAEQQRDMERARSGITTEMRRMQTMISPVEHLDLYAVADQYATIHDSPPSHRGPMLLTGGCMQVIKNIDIKLSYIADAEWEYGRRLCAEGGENLTDKQVLEIEAKILEFHAKQVVEAKKAKAKMKIAGGGGSK